MIVRTLHISVVVVDSIVYYRYNDINDSLHLADVLVQAYVYWKYSGPHFITSVMVPLI